MIGTPDFDAITGLGFGRINRLSDEGLFGPHNIRPGSGGPRRQFTYDDVRLGLTFKLVADMGGTLLGREDAVGHLPTRIAERIAALIRPELESRGPGEYSRWLMIDHSGGVRLEQSVTAVSPVMVVIDLAQVWDADLVDA